MKTVPLFVVIICSVFALSCSGSKDAAAADGEFKKPVPLTSSFKILSINLGHGLQDKTDVKKFADWVKTTGAEVAAVQQIERATDSKPGFDAFEELRRMLDMRGTFAKARYYQGWDSGNALFCLYPMMQSNVFPLPTGKGRVRRSLSFAVFELGLKAMAFASTDLDNDDQSERLKQVREIFSIQKSVEEYPMIVAGNFGESINGKASLQMREKYFGANSASDQLNGIEQHIYLPRDKKMDVLRAEKVYYKPLNQTGLLVTVEVVQ
jgi:endonuclease/exonuclease/phosphatase family metal-dependent hydrolase